MFSHGSYEFGLTIVQRAATLQSLHSGRNLEGNPCAKRCPRLLNRLPISNSVSNVAMTVLRSHACRCSTCWRVDRPTSARKWRTCWACIGTPSGAGWPSTPLGAWTPCWPPMSPPGKPVSLTPEVLASLEQALHRPEGFASSEALRQWVRRTHGVEVKYKTLYTIVCTRFRAKLKVPRPSHTKEP